MEKNLSSYKGDILLQNSTLEKLENNESIENFLKILIEDDFWKTLPKNKVFFDEDAKYISQMIPGFEGDMSLGFVVLSLCLLSNYILGSKNIDEFQNRFKEIVDVYIISSNTQKTPFAIYFGWVSNIFVEKYMDFFPVDMKTQIPVKKFVEKYFYNNHIIYNPNEQIVKHLLEQLKSEEPITKKTKKSSISEQTFENTAENEQEIFETKNIENLTQKSDGRIRSYELEVVKTLNIDFEKLKTLLIDLGFEQPKVFENLLEDINNPKTGKLQIQSWIETMSKVFGAIVQSYHKGEISETEFKELTQSYDNLREILKEIKDSKNN